MTTLAILFLGLVIGASLGGLGAGGSILAVPALIFLFDQPAHSATTTSLMVVAITAIVGTANYWRMVHWRVGLAFGAIGFASTSLGSELNQHIDEDLLLVCFACLMLLVGGNMLRVDRRRTLQSRESGVQRLKAPNTGTQTENRVRTYRWQSKILYVSQLLAASVVAGFLTGLFGVGGGFLIVPALTLIFGFSMSAAVGTSLFIMTLNSAAGIFSRLGDEQFDWSIIVPLAAAAIVGTFLGKYVNSRVSNTATTRALSAMILLVGAYTAIDGWMAFQ